LNEDNQDNRWIELEVRLAYQDRAIEQLNEAVVETERRIEELQAKFHLLQERITQESGGSELDDLGP